MARINDEITAMAPTCTPTFLKNKTEEELVSIRDNYLKREENINFYIKVLKKLYNQRGSYPFTIKDNDKSILVDYDNKVLKRYINCVNEYNEVGASVSLISCIRNYIKRKRNAYFGDKDILFANMTEEYIYYLSLDITLHNMYLKNQKIINDYLKKEGRKVTHTELLENYVNNVFRVNDIKEIDYTYVTPEELEAMGYEELPEDYALDSFLGPTSPKR